MASFIENEYRGVSLKMNDVFVSIDKDLPTPSKLDGLDDYDEMSLRIIGCEAIQDAGKMLKLPQVAIACSQVLYHRFYFSKSFVRHNWEHYAMSCVFLSAKIEECCRRLRDVVNVFVHIRQLREQKLLKCLSIPEYAELKPYIIKAERRVLKELGFCVHGKHPHKLICIYLHILGQDQNKDLVQLSWNYMNDSLRTTVFCCYQPEIIACACIYLAAAHLQFPLGQNWFEIFGADEDTIKCICVAILKLYSFKSLNVCILETKLSQLKKLQIESRNQKTCQDIKNTQEASFGDNNKSGRRSQEEDSGKKDTDSRNKENQERNKERQKRSHKRKNSKSPRAGGGDRRHRSTRSRSNKRDRSSDRKKKVIVMKGGQSKDHNDDRRYRKTHDNSGDNDDNNMKSGVRTSHRSPIPSSQQTQYRKRQRSSTSADRYCQSKTSSKHSGNEQRRRDNGKLYR